MKPHQLRPINGSATILWALLVVPTLFWWRESILWVALMSVWANVVSHYTAWQAARAECAATDAPTGGSTPPAPGEVRRLAHRSR